MLATKSRCEQCYTFSNDLEILNDDMLCAKCRKSKFFVLSVMPGQEKQVISKLKMNAKLKGLFQQFGKFILPKEVVVKISKDKYSVWSKGKKVFAKDPETGEWIKDKKGKKVQACVYHEDANEALWRAKQDFGDDYDVTEVRLEKHGGNRRVQRKVSYRGYVIVQFDITNIDVRDLVLKTFNVWGILPMIREDWSPCPLNTEEEALLMIEDSAPPEKKTNYKVGDKVTIVGGQYRGVSGKVLEIAGDDAKVTFEILGRSVTIVVKCDSITT